MKNWTIYTAETLFTFGKHDGKTLEQVAKTDAQYIHWCVKNIPEFLLDESDFITYAIKYAVRFVGVNQLDGDEGDLGLNFYVVTDADLLINQNKWESYEEYMDMQTNAIMIILISYLMDFLKGIPIYIMNTWVSFLIQQSTEIVDLELKIRSSFTVQIHHTDKA